MVVRKFYILYKFRSLFRLSETQIAYRVLYYYFPCSLNCYRNHYRSNLWCHLIKSRFSLARIVRFSLLFTIYKPLRFVAVRATEPWGWLIVTCFSISLDFSCFNFHLAFRTTSPVPIDFVGCFGAIYTIDYLTLSRIVNVFRLLHTCFVAPLSITHVLVLFISSALQATMIIVSFICDSFCFRFDL